MVPWEEAYKVLDSWVHEARKPNLNDEQLSYLQELKNSSVPMIIEADDKTGPFGLVFGNQTWMIEMNHTFYSQLSKNGDDVHKAEFRPFLHASDCISGCTHYGKGPDR